MGKMNASASGQSAGVAEGEAGGLLWLPLPPVSLFGGYAREIEACRRDGIGASLGTDL